MQINLYSQHINTLSKLNELAQKHNCVIKCYINNILDRDANLEKDFDCPEAIRKELKEKCTFCDDEDFVSGVIYSFELYDKNTGVHHSLAYKDGYSKKTIELNIDEDLSEEAYEWVESHLPDWQDMTSDKWELFNRWGGTEKYGFDNLAKPNVYREGMLLKYFGDLVCDYLQEERIVEVY